MHYHTDVRQAVRTGRSQSKQDGLGVALLVAGLAGWVDAAGFLHMKGLFFSFMSGNTTQLGAAFSSGDWHQVRLICGIVALFVAGVFLGERSAASAPRLARPLVLGEVSLLLWLGALADWRDAPPAVIVLLVVPAMGIQTATMHRLAGGLSIGLTYITGTLVQLGRKLSDASRGAGKFRSALPELALWLGFLAGAAAGASCRRHWGTPAALAVAAGTASLLALWHTYARVEHTS